VEKWRNYRFSNNIKKDIKNIRQNIQNRILYKDKIFPIKELTTIEAFVECIEGLSIKPRKIENLEFLEDLQKLQEGEVVNLKKYKLPKDNPWLLKNLENKINKGDISAAKEALKTPLRPQALQLLSQKASVSEILANDYPITKETILNNLDSNRLKELIDKSDLPNMDYIQIAQQLYQTITNPQELLDLFRDKIVPYVYLLIEYEMIDEAMEIASSNEIKFFEYYLLLRKHGEKIDIKEYINAKL
jgi:hypothetical protein